MLQKNFNKWQTRHKAFNAQMAEWSTEKLSVDEIDGIM